MEELGWDRGQDDEELFEFAMHENQYRDYKSGEAKKRFNRELDAAIEEKFKKQNLPMPDRRQLHQLKYRDAEVIVAPVSGRLIWELDFDDHSMEPVPGTLINKTKPLYYIQTKFGMEYIDSPWTGRIVGVEKFQGEMVNKGEVVAYLEKE